MIVFAGNRFIHADGEPSPRRNGNVGRRWTAHAPQCRSPLRRRSPLKWRSLLRCAARIRQRPRTLVAHTLIRRWIKSPPASSGRVRRSSLLLREAANPRQRQGTGYPQNCALDVLVFHGTSINCIPHAKGNLLDSTADMNRARRWKATKWWLSASGRNYSSSVRVSGSDAASACLASSSSEIGSGTIDARQSRASSTRFAGTSSHSLPNASSATTRRPYAS